LSTLKRYKDLEKTFSRRVAAAYHRVLAAVGSFFKRVHKLGRQKISIMLVPHTERRILNIQISFYGLACCFAVLAAMVGSLGFAAAGYSSLAGKLAGKADALSVTQSDLDSMRDTTARLVKSASRFQAALDAALAKVGSRDSDAALASREGDLAAFFDQTSSVQGSIDEVAELDRVSNYLERSAQSLADIGAVLASQGVIMTKIPNIWPIKGDLGHISMHYGQNENPIYGSWYIHKGIDVSTYRAGDPVVATADGKVVAVAFDVGLGYYIVIEHEHGFMTRYAHMKAQKVQKGQMVQQGQVIGFVGNTGISTGPHLHYEIHLGTDTIDPQPYMHRRAVSPALTN